MEQELAAEGQPVASLLIIAAKAIQLCQDRGTDGHSLAPFSSESEMPAEPAQTSAATAVGTALQTVLERALAGLVDEAASEEDTENHIDAIQGVVRALEADQGKREPQGATVNGTLITEGQTAAAVDGCRDAAWAALQQYVATTSASHGAKSAHVYILDILSALSQRSGDGADAGRLSRWGSWQAPAENQDGDALEHSLLLSCTAALVAPLWPEAAVTLTAADVRDCEAAAALFRRLLGTSRGAQQLGALAELLRSTWRIGGALASPANATGESLSVPEGSAAGVAGEAGACREDPELAAAQSALADFDDWGQDEGGARQVSEPVADKDCWVPQHEGGEHENAGVCAVHACWAALLVVMVKQGCLELAFQQLDAPYDAGELLTPSEAHNLARTTWHAAGAFALCAHPQTLSRL